jgi:HAD superfamily hydrolase (TIGR01509 family)
VDGRLHLARATGAARPAGVRTHDPLSAIRPVSAVDAVLFDFDGVLVDSEPVHFECWREILHPFEIELDRDYYDRHCIGISDREMIRTLVEGGGRADLFDQVYARYPEKKALFRDRMLAAPPIAPETLELLRSLSNWKLAVVTSSGRTEVEPILDRLGVLALFDSTVYGGDVERLKPAPDPYLKAAANLGVTRAIVVEDSAAGRESGRAAGFEVIEIERPSEVAQLVRARLGL